MSKALQQGHADGLCGIYSLLNFLNRTEWQEAPGRGLWYLLEACRLKGWLTPQYIVEGYEEYHLKAILDLQLENYRLPYETYFVSEVSDALGEKKFYPLAERITAKGGSLIANWGGEHWVLVTKQNQEIVRIDSARDEAILTVNSRQRALNLDYGLVILPKMRPQLKVEV